MVLYKRVHPAVFLIAAMEYDLPGGLEKSDASIV